MARHPNDQRLLAWLDGATPELDEHLADCERCAQTLDRLASPEADLGPALLSVLAPPTDLAIRVSERLAARVQNRRDAALFGSLLGISIETGRVVLDGNDQP
jgi:predicted anti-sigma-YlaC factor YlaD